MAPQTIAPLTAIPEEASETQTPPRRKLVRRVGTRASSRASSRGPSPSLITEPLVAAPTSQVVEQPTNQDKPNPPVGEDDDVPRTRRVCLPALSFICVAFDVGSSLFVV